MALQNSKIANLPYKFDSAPYGRKRSSDFCLVPQICHATTTPSQRVGALPRFARCPGNAWGASGLRGARTLSLCDPFLLIAELALLSAAKLSPCQATLPCLRSVHIQRKRTQLSGSKLHPTTVIAVFVLYFTIKFNRK